ncbi:MAG: FAD-dependent oxidoreductase [Desulfobacterales bacterium]
MSAQRVLIIGGGIGGLTAALALAQQGFEVEVVEKEATLGGHAARLACKAIDRCVKCGACLAAQTIAAASAHPRIRRHTACRVSDIRRGRRYDFTLAPQSGEETPARSISGQADAVVLAVGFQTFDPTGKPYGYGLFPDVITNLELEGLLRSNPMLNRPSNGAEPSRMAFIQCVGSRDAALGHLWCSAFCCAAAVRAARLLKRRRPELDITIFYIDIQNFGRDFASVYAQARREIRFVRAIPADAVRQETGRLHLCWLDDGSRTTVEENFDLLVLSTGMTPRPETGGLAEAIGLNRPGNGFLGHGPPEAHGAFVAGTARGPMSIAQTIADARHAAWQVARFLEGGALR